jgi:hypothetical protein
VEEKILAWGGNAGSGGGEGKQQTRSTLKTVKIQKGGALTLLIKFMRVT